MLAVQVPLSNGQTVWPLETSEFYIPYHQMTMSFTVAPSAGTITIEYLAPGDGTWVSIPEATNVPLSEVLPVAFSALASHLRFTLSGVVGGSEMFVRVFHSNIWPGNGMPEGVFWGNRAMTTQGYNECNVKRGVQYEVASQTLDLAIGGNIDTIFITGANPVIIKGRIVKFNGDHLTTRVYRDPVFTGGVSVLYFNLNDRNPVAGGVTILGGAVISSPGTEFGAPTFDLGSAGLGSQSLSTYSVIGNERLLRPNTTYLQRITNDSSAVQDVSGYLTWYEGGTDLPIDL